MSIRRFYLILAALLVVPLVHAAAPRDPSTHFFSQTLGDFQDELATAKAQGKDGILLFFEQADCPFCHHMKQTVLNQPQVQDYFKKHFLCFPVDIEGDVQITNFQGKNMSEKDFAFKQNRVRATPVFMFYNLQGKPVVRFTGETSGVHEFMLLGKYVVDGVYKKMPFIRYKREQRDATLQ
ncbi:MAG: thioredoxin fold domain-containing protein [Gammaproteobacteria bacterium]|jgi:thioredoxin-related protein